MMLLLTVSPIETQEIMAVAMFTGSPIQPIKPTTSTLGNTFGISDINPSGRLRNSYHTMPVIPAAASVKLVHWSDIRLSIKKANNTNKPVDWGAFEDVRFVASVSSPVERGVWRVT